MLFFLRKFFLACASPLSLVFLLSVAALLRRKRRKELLLLGLAIFMFSGYPMIPDRLMRSLCSLYSPVGEVQDGVREIVVLAAGRFSPDVSLPVNARVDPEGLARMVEGFRLLNMLPESRLWISMPGSTTEEQGERIRSELAALFHMETSRIEAFRGAKTTEGEAALIRNVLDTAKPFYLVTSDYHLPRAMRTFEKSGLHPLPAPAAQDRSPRRNTLGGGDFFPRASSFEDTRRWLHEQIGMLWLRGKGG